ncbi:MAG: 4-hydroxythreonine-4-phosphate dehydrogenase PdxA [Ignavibacteriales bacterium]|nr:4-hydroxythreonine-4-phosphate dehydrogenase PdxA [Ignavibacteriales bacterium]
MRRFIFTCGDINGIGPEICIRAFNKLNFTKNKIIFFCPSDIFLKTIKIIGCSFNYRISNSFDEKVSKENMVLVLDIGNTKQQLGYPTKYSGEASYKAVVQACELLKKKKANALITAPISKYAWYLAGKNFTGHTSLLSNIFNSKNYLMSFISRKMKCALLTIHNPIKEITKNVTKAKLQNAIEIAYNSLINDFKIKNPKVAILGLNPHAGEDGQLGHEEGNILLPVIRIFSNIILEGPFPADGFFSNKDYKKYDFVIGMYHDQILIPFKLLNGKSGVNYTMGLPIIRTSPAHGTAFDIADKFIADETGMIDSYILANKILSNRKISDVI